MRDGPPLATTPNTYMLRLYRLYNVSAFSGAGAACDALAPYLAPKLIAFCGHPWAQSPHMTQSVVSG